MYDKYRKINHLTIIIALVWPSLTFAQIAADDWGLHNIWGGRKVDEQSQVRGSYINVNWAELNPAPGKYDFSKFTENLQRFSNLRKPVTIAIHGKYKPDFLFAEVPYHPGQLANGVDDEQGTLQYWHPNYRKRYQELLQALASYLKNSPYRSIVYSVRLNLNAVGTEHTEIPVQNRDRAQWVVPAGVEFVPYSEAQASDYKRFVASAYHGLFAADFLVLVRTIMLAESPDDLPPVVLNAIANGTMGLMHTSSVPEPSSASTERKYKIHMQYAREGLTPVYAEPYAASSDGPLPPPQWNYWRILSDLHSGVTFLAVYGVDLEKSGDPEYATAFKFANKYSGYQTATAIAQSPGAWVALREGGQLLQGDYSFLMSRMSGDYSIPLESVGPNWQRFGAWARKVPAGGQMRFELNNRFANSLGSDGATVRLVYLDKDLSRFVVDVSEQRYEVGGGNKGTWESREFAVNASGLSGNAGADITVEAGTDVILHMVEVLRGSAGGSPPTTATAPPKSPNLISVN